MEKCKHDRTRVNILFTGFDELYLYQDRVSDVGHTKIYSGEVECVCLDCGKKHMGKVHESTPKWVKYAYDLTKERF